MVRRVGDRQNCKLVVGIDCVHVGKATFESVERLQSNPSRAEGGPFTFTLSQLQSAELLGSTFSRLYCESVQKLEVEQTCCVFASDSEHNRLMRAFGKISVSKQKF